MFDNKTKFVAAAAAMFAVPYLVITYHFLHGNSAMRRTDTLRLLELRVSSGSRVLAAELDSRYNLAALAAEKDFAQGGGSRKALLQERLRQSPAVGYEFSVLDARGRETLRVTAGKDGKPAPAYEKSGVLREAGETLAQAGAVEYGDYTPPALVAAAPLMRGGRAEGYLAGRLSLAYLCEVLRRLGRNSYGSYGLIDAGGQLIADSQGVSTVNPGSAAPPEILALVTAASDAGSLAMSREFGSGRGGVLAAVSWVPGTGWWVYEAMRSSEVPVYGSGAFARQVALSGFGLLICCAFAAWPLARRWGGGT
jgi:hypothetical protein